MASWSPDQAKLAGASQLAGQHDSPSYLGGRVLQVCSPVPPNMHPGEPTDSKRLQESQGVTDALESRCVAHSHSPSRPHVSSGSTGKFTLSSWTGYVQQPGARETGGQLSTARLPAEGGRALVL